MMFLPMQIRTYSISVQLMCIFKFISKETCNTKKVTFHVYFYYVKCYCCRSKEKIKPIWVYFGHIRLVYLAHLHIQIIIIIIIVIVIIIIWHGGSVACTACTAASQQEGHGFNSRMGRCWLWGAGPPQSAQCSSGLSPGPFCVEFACSP